MRTQTITNSQDKSTNKFNFFIKEEIIKLSGCLDLRQTSLNTCFKL